MDWVNPVRCPTWVCDVNRGVRSVAAWDPWSMKPVESEADGIP